MIGGADGGDRIYSIFDTEALLGRPAKVDITDKTGVDGIVVWVNGFLGLKGTKDEVGKLDVFKIQKWVMDQYNVGGRLTSISDAELEAQTKLHLPELYAKYKGKK